MDVVTAVTEAPVSYSTMLVKIDTNYHVGDEGAVVRREHRPVGRVLPEQYGSHILAIGGINTVKGPHGMMAVRTMAELGNGDTVELSIDNGTTLALTKGQPPVVNGHRDTKMRVGCGGDLLRPVRRAAVPTGGRGRHP